MDGQLILSNEHHGEVGEHHHELLVEGSECFIEQLDGVHLVACKVVVPVRLIKIRHILLRLLHDVLGSLTDLSFDFVSLRIWLGRNQLKVAVVVVVHFYLISNSILIL